MIPYVISIAYPYYKKPYLSQEFGVVKEEETQTYFLDKVCEFILYRKNYHRLKCPVDIENFFEQYFDDYYYYMGNSPWNAVVFRNGEWENMTPSNEKIWEHIQIMKLQEKEDKENEREQREEDNILDEHDKMK